MRNRPPYADLIETAREVLRAELLDALPREHRYTALMVVNALTIAAREAAAGDAPLRAELESLQRLLGRPQVPCPDLRSLHRALDEINRALAGRIRAGGFDPDDACAGALRDHLMAITVEKLRGSNPRYLEGHGLE